MAGRGRGEGNKIADLDETISGWRRLTVRPIAPQIPILGMDSGSGGSHSSSSSQGDDIVRGRGGYRNQQELVTIPEGLTNVRAQNPSGQPMEVLTNFVRISPIKERQVHQYRIDFKPNIESVRLRCTLFRETTETLFANKVVYDGMSDARSSILIPDRETHLATKSPTEAGKTVVVTIKHVGIVNWGSFEMLRLYNMNMKQFLKALGFYQVSTAGAYVHPDLATPIGANTNILAVRGFRTAANVHEQDQILINLESCHKLMQVTNVLQNMRDVRGSGDIRASVRAALVGKLVVTAYNKRVYRIEDVNFDLRASSTFFDRRLDKETTYSDYYKRTYDIEIRDQGQPLLLVIPNNNRKQGDRAGASDEGEPRDIYLIPELCNIAGLTDAQRNDNRLKIDLIRSSQISPADRVTHLSTFLRKLHESGEVKQGLERWGYAYDKDPVRIKARILPLESIGIGRFAEQNSQTWPKVDHMASFDGLLQRESVAVAPRLPLMYIIIARPEAPNEGAIMSRLRAGFQRVGLCPQSVSFSKITEGDQAHLFVQHIRNLPPETSATLIILSRQNKERYDAIKKIASVERGLITQVVTSKLMMDERRAAGAAIKIGVQLAAKLGGEPWYLHLPLKATMICGYDTHHDTAQRGRSFGAFVASMNAKYSKWFSKADTHDQLDELSTHLAENVTAAINKYREANGKLPERVFIYRDGVSDGQIEHVFKVELKQIKRAMRECDENIKLTFIIVNKRIGARFYMKNDRTYLNPPPGSVIDDVVTRKSRFDFYLVSQSTRNGTVSPTYYNIIYDQSGLNAERHQIMAFKLCFLYYNWTGTVRVPAPCQYAHKLAQLCGEHLHATPNSNLNDRLHFL